MKKSYSIFLAALVLASGCSTAATKTATPKCPYTELNSTQCERIHGIVKAWNKSQAFNEMQFATVKKNPEPCVYQETENRIELTDEAFKLSDASLTECVATAAAQARYSAIEEQWLSNVNEHEGYIVRDGVITQVSADKEIAEPAARMLWATVATAELVKETNTDQTNRSPASTNPDTEVRKLLGF